MNLAFLLIRDSFAILGGSKGECLSVLDLKDAYHTIKLYEIVSKPYFGILPYFGSVSFVHQKMSMELNKRATIWKYYINAILSSIPDRSMYLAIMSDLM